MTIKRLGIVGSGIMGSGIAECAARNGFEVVLRSRRQETADGMVTGMEKSLAKQVEKGKFSEEDRQATLSRVTATWDLGDLAVGASATLILTYTVDSTAATGTDAIAVTAAVTASPRVVRMVCSFMERSPVLPVTSARARPAS